MDDNLKRKRGRPRINRTPKRPYRLMIDDDMYDRLGNLSKTIDKSMADIFREAFNMYENLKLTQLSNNHYDDFYDDFYDEDDDFEDEDDGFEDG